MFKGVFINFTDSHLVALGFILFMGTFLGSLFWTLFVRKKSFYQDLGQLPLHDGDEYGK